MLASVLLASLLVAGCGGAGGEASDFAVTTVEGDEFALADKRGEVVALYFMAGY